MKLFLFILSFIILSISSMESPKTEEELRSVLEKRDEQIKELLGPEGTEYTDEQRDNLRNIINDIIDYREMARFALDEKFEELTTSEQEEFIELFTTIIRDQSLQQLDIYRAEVIYDQIETMGNEAKITTTAIHDEKRIPVLYRMKFREGEWVIIDMSIDDAWTGESYRRSFRNIIRRRGYDALIENLRQRAEKAA